MSSSYMQPNKRTVNLEVTIDKKSVSSTSACVNYVELSLFLWLGIYHHEIGGEITFSLTAEKEKCSI